MNEELRAAAERLRRLGNEFMTSVYSARPSDWSVEQCAAQDRRITSDAYLAEHPADEDMPADEEWIKQIARTILNQNYVIDEIGPGSFYIRFDCSPAENNFPGCMVLIHPPGDQLERGIEVLDNPTRGQIRGLCASLKVKFKEQK